MRANLVVQPVGSNKCGWYTLAFIENEAREFLGEGPACCHVALTVASCKPRLISFTKASAAEAEKQRQEEIAQKEKDKQKAEKENEQKKEAENAAKKKGLKQQLRLKLLSSWMRAKSLELRT